MRKADTAQILPAARRASSSLNEPPVPPDFSAYAQSIVEQVRNCLEGQLRDRPLQELRGLKPREFDRVVSNVNTSFLNRRMGLKELMRAARKELLLISLKKSTPRYSVDLMGGGVTPLEYFERFYLPYFLEYDIPANCVSIVDPNLHLQLNKRSEFPQVTKRLVKARQLQVTRAG